MISISSQITQSRVGLDKRWMALLFTRFPQSQPGGAQRIVFPRAADILGVHPAAILP